MASTPGGVFFYYYLGVGWQECLTCQEHFIDHVSCSKHILLKHSGAERLYLRERCGKTCVSIGSVSMHYVHSP